MAYEDMAEERISCEDLARLGEELKSEAKDIREMLRVCKLQTLSILDTDREQEFDDLVVLASTICSAPIAAITFIDENRQWTKAAVGIDPKELNVDRTNSFCTHTIDDPYKVMVVRDAAQDGRFTENHFVKGEQNVRFYAGAPLVAPTGEALGSLCVIDHRPRDLSPTQSACLAALARIAVKLLINR